MLYKPIEREKGNEMSENYTPPSFKEAGFNCPHCGVFAHQEWYEVSLEEKLGLEDVSPSEKITLSQCEKCSKYAVWINEEMIYPYASDVPLPLEDMPEGVKSDYLEARRLVGESPRSAAALLRMAIHDLITQLGESEEDIDESVENLKKKGLEVKMERALESVRVIGDGAVPPGQIDTRDDAETASILFNLLNLIVEALITQPRKVDELLEKLPDKRRRASRKRD